MKIVRLIDDFAFIIDKHLLPLRHFCKGRRSSHGPLATGRPLDEQDVINGHCDICHMKIPTKVAVMYNLWCWQNDRRQ